MEEFDGDHAVERRHGDGYSRLLSPHQRPVGGAQGFPGPASRVEAWQAQRGPKNNVVGRSLSTSI